MFAIGILAIVIVGVLQAMLQSRRMTEGSVRQASIVSLVQGYMEQFKSVKFAADSSNKLPSSPSASPGTTVDDWKAYTGEPDPNPTLPAKDSTQNPVDICLVPISLYPTTLPDIGTLPTDASRHAETVDIDGVTTANLKMWVWVKDLTGGNVVNCKAIVIVYQWEVKDGGRIRYYSDMMRTIRSVIPTE